MREQDSSRATRGAWDGVAALVLGLGSIIASMRTGAALPLVLSLAGVMFGARSWRRGQRVLGAAGVVLCVIPVVWHAAFAVHLYQSGELGL